MSRRNKKRKQRSEKHERKAAAWNAYIRAGEKAREDYDTQATENLDYYHGRHGGAFKELMDAFMQVPEGTAIKVNKAAQIRAVLGPKVYQQNPTRAVNSRVTDTVSKAMAAVMKSYVNYTPKETGLRAELRKAIDDSLMRGRGFMRTGYDDSRDLMTSWAVPSNNVVIDPDATSLKDVDDVQEARDSDGYPRFSSPPCAELLKDLGDGHRAAASRAALRLGQREELPDAV